MDANPIPQAGDERARSGSIGKDQGFYRYHLLYLTGSVRSFLNHFHFRREAFPLDKEVHDVIDVDCQQLS